jgi:hypothetical protein
MCGRRSRDSAAAVGKGWTGTKVGWCSNAEQAILRMRRCTDRFHAGEIPRLLVNSTLSRRWVWRRGAGGRTLLPRVGPERAGADVLERGLSEAAWMPFQSSRSAGTDRATYSPMRKDKLSRVDAGFPHDPDVAHTTVEELAEWSSVPVINGLTDLPPQTNRSIARRMPTSCSPTIAWTASQCRGKGHDVSRESSSPTCRPARGDCTATAERPD